jgi:hypothetical protein
MPALTMGYVELELICTLYMTSDISVATEQLNFNEAVNFALPDWLPLGLDCVRRYQDHKKLPVFSHDELIITITQQSQSIKTAIW